SLASKSAAGATEGAAAARRPALGAVRDPAEAGRLLPPDATAAADRAAREHRRARRRGGARARAHPRQRRRRRRTRRPAVPAMGWPEVDMARRVAAPVIAPRRARARARARGRVALLEVVEGHGLDRHAGLVQGDEIVVEVVEL